MDAFVGVGLVVAVLGALALWLRPWDKTVLRLPGGRDERGQR